MKTLKAPRIAYGFETFKVHGEKEETREAIVEIKNQQKLDQI